MATQEVSFEQGGPLTGDSGERGNATDGITSIKPYTDGERAVSYNLDRPPENLRKRTEVLRSEMEGQKYLQDADMRWVLSSGKADGLHDWGPVPPKTEWPVIEIWEQHPTDPLFRWYFSLHAGAAVVVQPLNTPAQDKQETKFWEFPDPVPGEGVDIAMVRRAYSLANIREVIWEAVPFAQILGTHGTFNFVDLTLSGEDSHILTITIRDDDFTLLGHLDSAFSFWNAAYLSPAGFLGSVTGALGNSVKISDIPPADVDYIFSGTADRELHYITSQTFVDFFDAGAPAYPNRLEDGDTIAIMWGCLVSPDPTYTIVDGRRQAIPANPTKTEVLYGQLFKTSLHPEWIPLGIPLCKRIGKELLWLDGTLATEGMTQPIRFGENGYTVERIYTAPWTVPISMTSMWFDYAAPPSWATVLEALDGIVADLAGTQDTTTTPVDPLLATNLLGIPEITYASPSVVNLNTPAVPAQISLLTLINGIIANANEKGSLNRDEDITGDVLGSFGWRVVNRFRFGENAVEIRDAHGATGLRLIYRNDGVIPAGIINGTTLSIYEGSATWIYGTAPMRVMLWGATIDATGSLVTAAAGNPDVSMLAWGPGLIFSATKQNAAGAWNPQTAGNWDTLVRETPSVAGERNIDAHSYFNRATAFHSRITYATQDKETGATALDTVGLEDLSPGTTRYGSRYRHRYVDPAAAVYQENRVIEGMYPYGHNNNTYPPTPDLFGIMNGAAIVGGREIVFKDNQDFAYAHTHFTNELNVYAADPTLLSNGWKFPCLWLYVWLRKDGEIVLDHLGPTPSFGSGAPPGGTEAWTANRGWSPRFNTGAFTRADYCLLGVLYAYKGAEVSPGVWYPAFADVRPVGGNLWRFNTTLYGAGGGDVVCHSIDAITIFPGGFNPNPDFQSSPTDFGNDIDTRYRTPGIPMSITSRGLVSYNMMLGYAGSAPANPEYITYSINHPALSGFYHVGESGEILPQLNLMASDGEMSTFPWPLATKFKQFRGEVAVEAYPMRDFADPATEKRWRGVLNSQALSFAGSSTPSGALYANGTLNLLGFYWDRDNCQNQQMFVV